MSDFSLSIDRTDLTLAPLVIHGTRETGWCVMPGWQPPGKDASRIYASSPFAHGAVQTHWTWQQALMSGDVLLNVADAAARTTAVAELEAALGRDSYEVTVTWNGVDTTWRCDTGSMMPSPLTYLEVDRDMPIYSLTIPCYPVAS